MKRVLLPALFLLLLLGVPFFMRPTDRAIVRRTDDELVITSSHTEMIKHEFARAFAQYYRQKTGRTVKVDYRNLGGTSDVDRYVGDRYVGEFRRFWLAKGETWDDDISGSFSRDIPDATPRQKKARQAFLASDIGIGIDLIFSGGTYEHKRRAKAGYAVDAKVRERHPEYFTSEVIPQNFGGEEFYDKGGRFYGTCLASFGLCYNSDRLAEIGMAPPRQWRDLADPRLFRKVAVADPSKSGSVNKCFEMILQQSIAENLARNKTLDDGWKEGFALIRRIVANARLVADSAGRVTSEVAGGNAAAGMGIDFYVFTENSWSARCFDGKPKIFYVPPQGGTAVTADQIQLLRGAPNRRVAEHFIDFVLSKDGQRLWDSRIGTPGGPARYELRRPSIRRDFYTPEENRLKVDPDYNPYSAGGDSHYNPAWTGKAFSLIRVLIRTTMIDVADELIAAQEAILAAGGEEKVPEAAAAFDSALPVAYSEIEKADAALRVSRHHSALDVVKVRREWSLRARDAYRKAAELAREGR